MMAWRTHVWRQLTRPRQRVGRRVTRMGRGSRGGVALLTTIALVALMGVIVTEITFMATMRLQLAANQRDEAKAEALAQAGVQFYRLILIASKQLGQSPMIQSLGPMLGVNADTLWQLVPEVGSGFLRFLLMADGDKEEASELARAGIDAALNDGEEIPQTTLKKHFLDFDGDFQASVQPEDQRIFVGSFQATTLGDLQLEPKAGLLIGLMSGDAQSDFLRERDLEMWELIGNLSDWTDPDDTRIFRGGSENALYERLEPPYLSKNGAFDSREEIRLVDGWNSDQVWYRFGQHLTIYGSGKVNVNAADRRVLEALLFRYIQPQPRNVDIILDLIMQFRRTPPELGGGLFRGADSFVGFIQQYAPGTIDPAINQVITTESEIFRITSKGDVRNANVSIEAVLDFSKSPMGKVVYWNVR
ncbi:MAG: general secretion pathway protein GspK [Myxococcota bacterium]